MPKHQFTVVLAACAFGLGVCMPAAANAAATLSLTAGPEPVESITTQLIASGSDTGDGDSLQATLKATGGEGCGSNPQADGGEALYFSGGANLEAGTFSLSINHTFARAGTYLLCAWILSDEQASEPVQARDSLTISVRPPHLVLSISAPATALPSQAFQITTTAQAETERTVEEFVVPDTGRGCPVNSDAASSTSAERQVFWPAHYGSGWNVDGGPFSESINETLEGAGVYLICAYVEYLSDQNPPEATANALVTVTVPPAPCVVPNIHGGSALASAEKRIRMARCAIGPIHRVQSRRYRRGLVVRLGVASGRHLPSGAAVAIYVSKGQHR
jgi:hypothetical protein